MSKDETLEDILSDIPKEVLTGYDAEEAFTPNYKEALFPRSRPPDAPIIEKTQSVFHEEETIDPEDNFYFESDHLALKGNKDYRDLLKVIVTLQAQRTQAIKDLDVLLLAKKQALEDPIAYVAKLQNGDLPEYPGPQKIPELPEIDWSKYNVAQPDNNMRPQTRNAKNTPQPKDIKFEDNSNKLLVRGRTFDETKPETFNKLWTTDEQRRLEELLIKYPPEDIEMRRWTKIANALGNRTPKQVSSRVQKYFIKLMKAGLPIPGRGPKMKSEIRKSSSRHKSNYTSFRKSTFFPHEQILDEIKREPSQDESDDDDLVDTPDNNGDNDELSQMELLRQVKIEKYNSKESTYLHFGYKCYICGEAPIKHIRWHCKECQEQVDLCSDCAIAQLEAEDPIHPSTHKLEVVRPPKYSKYHDTDYLPQNFSTTSYNYLDPNYLPD
ncbi:PREDICTED: ZZ-type zinc finger-containing protein 3 [Ceratosolen solmsi marchali]|uniref:ZZ-type zinc finger-containing protein 3 n=1 Tax=Ceratosolen solmsi marchali TaxID=326594 RepID=A0AAJ6VNF1_9HYME|nr:PREDICTED: ZZ-type zinc finger-containing protein 3 [Ceratosolen solmsi marchali]